MKKFKIVISFVLVISLLMCAFSFSASAGLWRGYDFDPETYEPTTLNSDYTYSEKIDEFDDYCTACDYYFVTQIEELNPLDVGNPSLYYDSDSYNKMRMLLQRAYDEVIAVRYEGEVVLSDSELEVWYNEIKVLAKKMAVARKELLFLCNIVFAERNDNNYYDEDIWNNFKAALNNAEAVLADETIVDYRVTDAYWRLMHSYNSLCISNKLMGDVNKDGVFNILDATAIQKSLAKLTPELNSSQCMVGTIVTHDMKPSILDVAEMQKVLARLSEPLDQNYSVLLTYPESKNFRANEIVEFHYIGRLTPPWYYDNYWKIPWDYIV